MRAGQYWGSGWAGEGQTIIGKGKKGQESAEKSRKEEERIRKGREGQKREGNDKVLRLQVVNAFLWPYYILYSLSPLDIGRGMKVVERFGNGWNGDERGGKGRKGEERC